MNSTFIKFIDPSIFVITIGHWEIKSEGQSSWYKYSDGVLAALVVNVR